GVQAPELRGDVVRDRGHGPELDRSPAEELYEVERGRHERAADAQHRAKEHHARHALPRARETDEREQQTADEAAGDDREERAPEPERRNEERSRDEDEEPDREISPEDEQVEPA